jgi:hypothetical protein
MSGSSIRATILDRLRSLIFFYGVLYITWNRGLPVSGASSHLQDLMHNVAKLDPQFRRRRDVPDHETSALQMRVSLGMLDLLTFRGSGNDLIVLRVRFLEEIAPQVELESD